MRLEPETPVERRASGDHGLIEREELFVGDAKLATGGDLALLCLLVAEVRAVAGAAIHYPEPVALAVDVGVDAGHEGALDPQVDILPRRAERELGESRQRNVVSLAQDAERHGVRRRR